MTEKAAEATLVAVDGEQPAVEKAQKKVPAGRALVLNEQLLSYAVRVYAMQHGDSLPVTVESGKTTTLDVDEVPEAFLGMLLQLSESTRIKLSAKTERIIRKKLGDHETSVIKSIPQFYSIMQLLQSGAKSAKRAPLEAKINGRWYPVMIGRVNMYDSMFSGKYVYLQVTYSIGDQNQNRTLYITSTDLKDDNDPLRELTMVDILAANDLRICTDQAYEAYRAQMQVLRDLNTRPGTVLMASTSCLSMNKFLWMNFLSPTPLGTPKSPKQVLVEPELETQTGNDHYYMDDEEVKLTLPFVRAFSLTLKKYVYLDVADITVKQWAENAMDRLHLPQEMRTVLTQVFTAPDVFGDMFSGRHGGMVVLANGPSGVGKTLTAEVFSEMTKRPLYSLEMGELGTNLDQVEQSLQRIFARAARWNAVLLFDEADIFLSKRTEDDLERSAIVGVFLRLLDQYEGMFFLTTNRAEVIDPAFASRITLRLDYPKIDNTMRARIWSNMLGAAGISLSPEVLQALSEAKDLNGRQIRNQVRLLKIMFKTETTLTIEQATSCLKFAA